MRKKKNEIWQKVKEFEWEWNKKNNNKPQYNDS